MEQINRYKYKYVFLRRMVMMMNCSFFLAILTSAAVLLAAAFFLLQLLFLSNFDRLLTNRGGDVWNSSVQYSTHSNNVVTTNTTVARTYSSSSNNDDDLKCATWLPKNKRKILLVGFHPLTNLSWISEEFHLTMGLTMVLPRLGFDVDHMTQDTFKGFVMKKKEQESKGMDILSSSYHQIYIMRSTIEQPLGGVSDVCSNGIVSCCNMRVIFPDVPYSNNGNLEFETVKLLLHEKQILTTTPMDGSTEIASYYYSPFLSRANVSDTLLKPKDVGTVYLSRHGQIHELESIVRILLKKELEVHVFLDTAVEDAHAFKAMKNVQVHANVLPNILSPVLARSVFLVVCGGNFSTFLFLLTLSHGASVIHVQQSSGSNRVPWFLDLGMPYVYRVEAGNTKSLIKAVNNSISYRFLRHDPISPGEFEDALCAIVEDDSVCKCHAARSQGDDIDCRSSFYMKKSTIFPST
jgi:hypothetical protein